MAIAPGIQMGRDEEQDHRISRLETAFDELFGMSTIELDSRLESLALEVEKLKKEVRKRYRLKTWYRLVDWYKEQLP